MSDVSILNLGALSAASLQSDDYLAIVDVHDATQSPAGSTKKILLSSVFTSPTFITSVTLTGGTVTVSAPVLTATQTWNAGGVTFTGWKLNITDTASAAASLLLDLQVATVSKWSVTKGGATTQAGALTVSAGGAAITGTTAVTGAATVSTTLTVGTGLTISAGGAAVTGASSITGVLTLSAALTFTAAASKIIPGATSFSHRNTADTADNLLISDAGAVTIRSTLAIGGALSGVTTLIASGLSSVQGGFYVRGTGTAPSGQNIELTMNSGTGNILAYDRTGLVFLPLVINSRVTVDNVAATVAFGTAAISGITTGAFSGTITSTNTSTGFQWNSGNDAAAIVINRTSANNASISWQNNGTTDWQIGQFPNSIATGRDFIIFNQAVGTALRINVSTSAVTIASALTVTSGGLTVSSGHLTVSSGNIIASSGNVSISAGNIVFGLAAAKIIPGSTSLSIRNSADSADNLLITDAGAVTVRSTLALPNDTYYLGRNNAGSGNVNLIKVNVADQVIVGGNLALTSTTLGFYGGSAAAKQTVTGSKGANAALTSLMAALSTLGLVTDSTT